jgi:hypothetical protein
MPCVAEFQFRYTTAKMRIFSELQLEDVRCIYALKRPTDK